MTSEPRPLDFTDHTGEELRHTAHRYRLELGWATTVHGSQLVLELDDDIQGLQLPTALAAELVTALRAVGLSCPVVDLPGQHVSRSVALLEPAGPSLPAFPTSVGTLPPGHRIPLPPSMTAHGPVRWLTSAEPDGGTHPSIAVVADTLAGLTRMHAA